MINEANQNQAADAHRRELADLRNTADSTAYQVEKMLNDLGMAVPSEMRADAERCISDLRQAVTGDDANRIRRLTEELQQVANRVGQAAQQQQRQPQGGPAGPQQWEPQNGPGDDDVIDGTYRPE